jgi:hypothetical protein
MAKHVKTGRNRAVTKSGRRKEVLEREAAGALGGAAAGAAVGAIAGPPGAAAGVVLGAAAAVLAERAAGREAEKRAREDARLDAEIGVSGGDLGAPNLRHPPARVGAYSAASSGAGGGRGRVPAEGPIPDLDDD